MIPELGWGCGIETKEELWWVGGSRLCNRRSRTSPVIVLKEKAFINIDSKRESKVFAKLSQKNSN